MKAAMVEDIHKVLVKDVRKPTIGGDEVLIKVQYCGICGSDIHRYRLGAPLGIGHEFSGDVVEIGSGVKNLEVGDRVAVEPHRTCGECAWCKRGDEIGLCEKFYEWIEKYEGAFRTYVKTKYFQAYKLPDDLSYEHAALIEPTAVALYAVQLSEMQEGDVIAVLGLGPIGQLVTRVAKALGAKAVYATERIRSRLDLAKGAADEIIDINKIDPVERILELTDDIGPDIVIECAGTVSSAQQSIALARKGGTIVTLAICFDWVSIPFTSIALKGLTIKGYVCWKPGTYAAALDLINDKKIDVAPLIECKMRLDDIAEAFDQVEKCEGGTILIKP